MSAPAEPIRSRPGWSRGCRLAVTVARDLLWLAAIHPGQAAPPPPPRQGIAVEALFRIPQEPYGLTRPVIEVLAIQPRNVAWQPAPPRRVDPSRDPLAWARLPDVEDELYIYWPARPKRAAVRAAADPAPVPGAPMPDERAAAASDDAVTDDESTPEGPVLLPLEAVLLEPNGGESWPADSLATIRWRVTGGVEPVRVRLDFSLDDGRRWRLLADSLGNSGSHEWVVPHEYSRRVRLRVSARDDSGMAGVDASDRVLTLRPPAWVRPVPPPVLALAAGTSLPGATFRLALDLAEAGAADLVILAVTGRLVRRLWSGVLPSGRSLFEWDGVDGRGAPAPAGVYFARLTALGSRLVRRLVLVRGRRRRHVWSLRRGARYTRRRRPF